MSFIRKHTVFFNFSSLGIIQVANFFLSLAVIPYVIKIVGAEGFGVIAVAQVLMFYLTILTDYGFNRTAIRDIVLYRSDKKKISQIFFTVLYSKLIISLVAFVLLLILVATVPLFRQHAELYLLAFSFVIGQSLLMNWFFQGLEKMQYVAFLSLFARLLFVAFVFLFLKQKEDVKLYLFFMGLGNILAGLMSIFLATRFWKLTHFKPALADLKYELKEGWHITLTNLSQITIQYIGVFILRIFTDDLVVGYYSIAERVYFAMKMMLDVFTQAAYPRVCLLLQEGIMPIKRFFRRTYLPFLYLVVLGSAAIFALAPAIINFFMGHYNSNSAFLLRVLCVALVIVCLQIPASLILLAGNHKTNYLRVFTVGTFVNIATNLAFVPIWNSSGTVASVIITELLIVLYLYWELYRLYRVKKPTGDIELNDQF